MDQPAQESVLTSLVLRRAFLTQQIVDIHMQHVGNVHQRLEADCHQVVFQLGHCIGRYVDFFRKLLLRETRKFSCRLDALCNQRIIHFISVIHICRSFSSRIYGLFSNYN